MAQLYVDKDGVLADFEGYAEQVLGMKPREYEDQFGTTQFWARLKGHKDFFFKLKKTVHADVLWREIQSANPYILTGCPRGNWAEDQKKRWASYNFNTDRIITCASKEKYKYCRPGDVLVDDWLKYRGLWEEAGGIFVHYKGDIISTLTELRSIGII